MDIVIRISSTTAGDKKKMFSLVVTPKYIGVKKKTCYIQLPCLIYNSFMTNFSSVRAPRHYPEDPEGNSKIKYTQKMEECLYQFHLDPIL